jgi:ATP synthase protein I
VVNDVTRVVPFTLLAQACVSAAVALALWFGFGNVAAASALLGGAAVVIPNAFLAARLLAPSTDQSARAMMRSAWIGEIGKLLLTGLAFGVIFAVVRPIAPPAVFAGFIAAQMVIFGALLLGGGAGGPREELKS